MFTSLAIASLTTVVPAWEPDRLHREDRDVRGLHVREVRLESAERARPVILLHGARVPGVASFDLPVPGGSLAEDLASGAPGDRRGRAGVRRFGAATGDVRSAGGTPARGDR